MNDSASPPAIRYMYSIFCMSLHQLLYQKFYSVEKVLMILDGMERGCWQHFST